MRALLLLIVCSIVLCSVGCATSTEQPIEGLAFYPSQPLVRTFSYSRVAPDGSTLLGTITFALQGDGGGVMLEDEATLPIGRPVETRVSFAAGGVAFSPQQARVMHPMIDWPATDRDYPLGVPDVQEEFAYLAVLGGNRVDGACVTPTDAAMFWAQGVFTYLGMPRAPTAFVTSSIAHPGDPSAVCIRGAFKRNSERLGTFVFTLRKNHGLSSVSATLADGTTIALVERFSHPLDQPDPALERPREQPLFALLYQ